MQRFSNITGQARHGLEKTGLVGSRPAAMDIPPMPQPLKRPINGQPMSPMTPSDGVVHLSFNVPFSSNLAGPEPQAIIHASPKAVERWTFPEGTEEGTPIHKLPVHHGNVEQLKRTCRVITEGSQGRIEADVKSAEPKTSSLLQTPMKGLVTNVCVSSTAEEAHKIRAKILNENPIMLRCAVVDIDTNLVINEDMNGVRAKVLEHIDQIAKYTGTDIFLLNPKSQDAETVNASFGVGSEMSFDQRLRITIYGDPESSEHAKTRVLLLIDQILQRHIDGMRLELSLHNITCGRTRKNIRLIEAVSNTAIYFPPPFPRVYGYTPPGSQKRGEDEIYITGESKAGVDLAKKKIRELVLNTKCYVKDVVVNAHKIDSILLDRLEKVRKIMETNGTYVLFPQLGSQRSLIRVQGTEILHVERTVRDIMALAGQFYSATWYLMDPPASTGGGAMRMPQPGEVRTMLSDICTNSGTELGFERLTFSVNGSDDAVKAAMMVIQQIPFVKRAQCHIRVKIELANEHKEFVSGKKNGKINKIMGQSNVQIIFDGFNEYNFYIDVCGSQYSATKNGLELVEQEMPASISFHVPDQYHKRIIGIGGQHIQRIMKRYSVFVKFSNAMDRGGVGKDDDDIKIDNVICRTPARNAQSLELVKQEIMDMVEKVVSHPDDYPEEDEPAEHSSSPDAEFVSETVVINRLYHRQLIARMNEIDDLEKKWNCKIDFPPTEMASDVVTISGPEYQVPQAVDEFLGMVPESHEIVIPANVQLREYLKGAEFDPDVRQMLKASYEVELEVRHDTKLDNLKIAEEEPATVEERLLLQYTRNNAGGLKDAIDFLVSRLIPHGLDAATVKGAIPRPKSDSFEESLPFFDSKLLHNASTPLGTDSPTRSTFGDDISDRGSLFGKIRKPGSISSISSFLDRRKQHSSSQTSFFKQASANASRASLVSMESRDSGYRNPWNDSGINLPEDNEVSFYPNGNNASTSSFGSVWPPRLENKSDHKLPLFANGGYMGGDITPRYDPRASHDSGRPSTSHSTNGYPAPIGPPRL